MEFSPKRRQLMFEVQVFAPMDLAQLVLPGMIAANFTGLFAPARTPAPIIERIAAAKDGSSRLYQQTGRPEERSMARQIVRMRHPFTITLPVMCGCSEQK